MKPRVIASIALATILLAGFSYRLGAQSTTIPVNLQPGASMLVTCGTAVAKVTPIKP